MRSDVALIGLVVLVASFAMTRLMRRLASIYGILDIPNERSSHTKTTPRGGGLAIVLTATAGMIWLGADGTMPLPVLIALTGGGTLVAIVGFLDDRFGLRSAVRFVVHVAAAAWAVFWLGGVPPIRVGAHIVQWGWLGDVLGVVGLVWTVNLFNFMDGIDGIAASEAVFIAVSGALLTLFGAGTGSVFAGGLVFGAACGGFLLWNWPPAKIFMGDVGSGYIGYMVGVLALAAARASPDALWIWLILGGAFFIDATVTLARRAVRGERVHEAHRSHAYQWSARRWGHKRVTVAVSLLNLVWLLPSALLAMRYPERAVLITVGTLAPLLVLALALGSGRREPEGPEH
jgi:Fuc2NAc and GlcNAc transferase